MPNRRRGTEPSAPSGPPPLLLLEEGSESDSEVLGGLPAGGGPSSLRFLSDSRHNRRVGLEVPMQRDAILLPLIHGVYRAALDRPLWHRFASQLEEAVGDATVTLAIRRPGTRLGWDYFGAGSRDLAIRIAEDLQGALELAARRVEGFRRGFVALSQAFPHIALESDPWFEHWLDPAGIPPIWPFCHAVSVDRGIVCWILVQPAEGFDEAELHAIGARLVPHLARALRVEREIGARNHQQRALGEVLDRLPTGVILIDPQQRVIQTNLSAQRMLALDDGIALRGERLRARPAASDEALRSALQGAIEAASRGDFQYTWRLSIPARSGRRPFLCAVTPLFAAVAGSAVHDAVAAVYLMNADAVSTASVRALRAVYGLTGAEAAVVRALAEGIGLEQIAERRGVTLQTVRGQLKQVFSKTRTSRQAELIRLVLTGVPPLPALTGARDHAEIA